MLDFYRLNSVEVDEGDTLYLTVFRSNGLDMTMSVEWETVSDSAVGLSKQITAL